MKQHWNFRCYPTPTQAQILARTFGSARFVYNWALNQRIKAFENGEKMSYNQSSGALTTLKHQTDTAWLNEVSCVPLQQSLRHLQTAFKNFFEKRAGHPTFKRKYGKQSAEYTRSAFRFELGNQRLVLAKLGPLKVKWSKHVPVNPTTVTVIRKPSGRYFVSLVVEVQPALLPKTGKSVGIDFGITHLATLSNGEHIANPRYLNRYQRRMKRQQQALTRKQFGSRRYFRQRQRVARLHEKIANSRKDAIAKLAWRLVTHFDTIYVEDLNLRGMVKNHNLARSVYDVGIGTIVRAIEAKATMHGKHLIKIDRWFPSSKQCSACGVVQATMPLHVRNWTCSCGAVHDRDLNAAQNILAAGHAVTARGADVRPPEASASGGNLRRSVNHLNLQVGNPRV